MAFRVCDVIITESLHALQDHVGGLVAYCAVGRCGDCLGCLLDGLDGLHVAFSVNEVVDEAFELWETYAAGYTLSAGLGGADFDVAAGNVKRTDIGRRACDSPFEILVKRLNGGLSFCLIRNAKSTQYRFTPSLISVEKILPLGCDNYTIDSCYKHERLRQKKQGKETFSLSCRVMLSVAS